MDLGFDAAGIETLWQCEIDDKPRSVLAKHWPDAVRYTDVKTVKGADVIPVDIITFGSPCQDLSVAGKRAGLAGNRSGLYHEAIRIIKEMRDATQNQYPQIAIWENVRGALSSNEGRDFHAAIQALAKLGAVDISYRLVNACHFGVPQRRVRVFVVADFRGERAGEILAKPTRLLWHPPQVGEDGQEVAGETEGSTASQSAVAFDEYNGTTNEIHHTLRAGTKQSTGVICPTIVAGLSHLTGTTQDGYVKAVALAITERAGKPGGGKGLLLTEELSPTLNTGGGQQIAKPEEETYTIRRLTPVECERLMGWPDDHTKYDKDGNELSDSARYKMCGNGIASPVAQWLGENIVEELT
jgi:DNA (cytosine-5)-methyltransferase 1